MKILTIIKVGKKKSTKSLMHFLKAKFGLKYQFKEHRGS